MSDYRQLDQKVERIVRYAIQSEMFEHDYVRRPDGSYELRSSTAPLVIPGPESGRPTGSRPAGITYDSGNFDPGKEVYEKWERRIEGLFRDWRRLPDPRGFDSDIDSVVDVMRILSAGEPEHDRKGRKRDTFMPESSIHGDMRTASENLSDFSGETVYIFRRRYVQRFSGVCRSQYYLARALRIAIEAEREVWVRARRDIARIADDAADAMRDSIGGGSDWTSVLEVVGAVGSVAALYPGLGSIASKVPAGADLLAKVFAGGRRGSSRRQHGGDSAEQVFDGLRAAADRLETEVGRAEARIVREVARAVDICDREPELFRPGHPMSRAGEALQDLLGESEPRGVVSRKDEMVLEPRDLRRVGDDLFPDIARRLRVASRAARDAASSSRPYERPDNLGRRGGPTSYLGPYGAVQGLALRLEATLDIAADDLREAGDVLSLCARSFTQTDEQVSAALRRRQRRAG